MTDHLGGFLGRIRQKHGGSGLGRDGEREAAERRDAGDTQAVHELVEANVLLVMRHAGRVHRRVGTRAELDDLVAYGIEGLYHAAKKFDPDKGFKFSTYAEAWIMQGISRGISKGHRAVGVPINLDQLASRVRRLETVGASDDEIADAIERGGGTAETVRTAIRSMQAVSLDAPLRGLHGSGMSARTVGPDGTSMEDMIAGDDMRDMVDRAADVADACDQVTDRLERLNDLERRIIELRWGLGGGEPLPHTEIDRMLDLPPDRSRNVAARAMSKMRHPTTRTAA